jgi:redox-sensitive bicupin YhaK (pirin superfamily)
MSKQRSIQAIIPPPAPHMVGDGFRVHNFFPSWNLGEQRMSPFFMMDYNSKVEFAPREEPRGVGVHPHRGFETVTIAYKGKVAHHDSYGHHGVISEGDVQWMTAGSGVLHKEYHEKEFSRHGGEFQMVQLWVNLPKAHKMTTPRYQEIINANIPKIKTNGVEVEIIAGQYNELKGAAQTFSPVNLFNINFEAAAESEFRFPNNYNTAILIIEGSILVNGSQKVATDHFVLMNNDGEAFAIKANESSKVLLLSGEPINEPVFAYGPFVMNTREEIVQAMDDFNNGKFGVLED